MPRSLASHVWEDVRYVDGKIPVEKRFPEQRT